MSIYTYIFTYTYRFIHIKKDLSYWTLKNTYRLGTEIYFVHAARIIPSPVSDSNAYQSNKTSSAAVKKCIMGEGCVLRGSYIRFLMIHFSQKVYIQSAGFSSSASTSK